MAKPVVDDDNVDLVVNYRRTVQVKTARSTTSVGQYVFMTKRLVKCYEHVDVLALWGVETDDWWLIPCAELFGRWPSATSLAFRPRASSNGLVNVRTRWLEQWLDRWDVFGRC